MRTVPLISEEERTRRQEAVRFARNSVRLEGFKLSAEAEELFQHYINGELTRPQLNEAVRKLAYDQAP